MALFVAGGGIMINYPKTLDEAKQHKYRRWAGNSKGNSYREGYCAYEVFSTIPSSQCSRKAKAGPGGLYCKQHAKLVQPIDEVL